MPGHVWYGERYYCYVLQKQCQPKYSRVAELRIQTVYLEKIKVNVIFESIRLTHVAFLLALRTFAVASVSLVMRHCLKIGDGHFLLHYFRFISDNHPTMLHLARQLI
jgi:hypothetical protein